MARLHTEILKHQELKDFYELYPERFNNKTNGITQRRFLLHGNPLLADWVTAKAGEGWIKDLPQIEKLKSLAEDPKAQKEFMDIKYQTSSVWPNILRNIMAWMWIRIPFLTYR